MSRQRPSYAIALVLAGSAILSLLVYARAFDNPFRQDDFTFLRHVESHGFPEVLNPGADFAFFRPGAMALFALEEASFDRHNGYYIVFNYLLHAAIALLAFLTLRRLCGADTAALAAGLFLAGFGHYGKQVMWACASGPMASVALSTGAILVLLPARDGPSPTRGAGDSAGRALGSAALLAAAVLFHEAAAALCVVAAVIVTVSAGGPRKWETAAPFLVVLSAALVLWITHLDNAGYHTVAFGEAATRAPVHLVQYLGFLVLPLQPSVMVTAGRMPDLIGHAAVVVRVVFGVAMLAALLHVMLRKTNAIRLLALWLLVAILPFTVLPHPPQRLELRYLYPAAIPFCGLAAVVVLALWNRRRRGSRLLAGAMVMLALAGSVALQVILESHYDQWH